MSKPSTRRALALAMLTLAALPAQALVVLGFEGVNATYPSTSSANIAAFYNGGVSSQGTSGVNYGINFSSNAIAICLNAVAGSCSNASRGGLSATSSQGALGLAASGSAWLDVPAGFTFAIGFSYAVAPGFSASIAAYSGPAGTGTLLAPPLVLVPNAPGCAGYNAVLCPLGPGGYSFLGTAQSVVFTGPAGKVVWDDLTLGANDPQPPPAIPEPATGLLWLAGLAGVAGARRRAAHRSRG